MNELIAHLFGDYVIQNHWMATNKTRSSIAAFVHAITYTLPFLLITSNPAAITIIFGTHFVIDRWRLASYWCRFWGNGCSGVLPFMMEHDVAPWESWWHRRCRDEWQEAPEYLRVWLFIIVDNAFHLLINHFALSM